MDHEEGRRTRSSTNNGIKPDEHKYFYEESGLEILAYLQYTIDERLPFVSSKVVSHCRERFWSIVSVSTVEDKLRLYWDHWHADEYKATDWKKIYRLGIRGLPHLDEDKVKWVKARAGSIKNSLDAKGTPRQLRSASYVPRESGGKSQEQSSNLIKKSGADRIRKRRRDNDTPTPKREQKRTGGILSVSYRRHLMVTTLLTK